MNARPPAKKTRMDETLSGFIACPICNSSINIGPAAATCSACGKRYPLKAGIIDFYPAGNQYEVARVAIYDQYEEIGKTKSRRNTYPEMRRRQIAIELSGSDSLLEIGCAEGWMTAGLLPRVKTLFAADVTLSYLERASQALSGPTFLRLDAHYLPFASDVLAGVVMTEVLEHLKCPYRALEEIYRILKPGGDLVLSVPNSMTPENGLRHLLRLAEKKPSAHLSSYDTHGIVSLLRFVGFEPVEIRTSVVSLPGISRLFHFDWLQAILTRLFRNFGKVIIVKARKVEETLWSKLIS